MSISIHRARRTLPIAGYPTLLLLCMAFHGLIASAEPSATAEQNLGRGTILPKVVTAEHADQSYALYLPSNYSADRRWPVVYAFDPGARGAVPVELIKDAAEKYGYIVAGSNNSRNGSWKLEAEAAQAMFRDTRARLAIDDARVYFAGFSGGSRLSAELASRCACAAGVFLAGAGFQPEKQGSHGPFAVFASVGSYDFNYGEVVAMDEALEKVKASHYLRRFDGPHEWPPAEVFDEALGWFRVAAMKAKPVPRDDAFIATQFSRAVERARSVEKSDPFVSWFEYRQAAETFEGLLDVTGVQSERQSLEKQKAISEGLKRERQEVQEQESLAAPIFAGFAALPKDTSPSDLPRTATRGSVRDQIVALRSRIEHERRVDKVRVMKRALGGILVSAMESGMARREAHDERGARDFFELASAADPDAVWPLMNVATARASDGDTKGALTALRNLKTRWTDHDAFATWVNSQAAFTKLRDTPAFQSLLP